MPLIHKLAIAALYGLLSAICVDLHAYGSGRRSGDSKRFSWRVACMRYAIGALTPVVGLLTVELTSFGLGMPIPSGLR